MLCGDCRTKIVPQNKRFCFRCGVFTPILSSHTEGPPPSIVSDANPCVFCRNEKYLFSRVIPLGEYDAELRNAVLRMKSDQSGLLAAAVSRLLTQLRLTELKDTQPDMVVPIPMHFFRRVIRGVNSPEVIGEQLGRTLNIPLVYGIVVRTRLTVPQSNLKPADRLKNVRKAFRLGYSLGKRSMKDRINGKRILLVDDILTTGATANEVSRILLQNGAKSVVVSVLARALPGF